MRANDPSTFFEKGGHHREGGSVLSILVLELVDKSGRRLAFQCHEITVSPRASAPSQLPAFCLPTSWAPHQQSPLSTLGQ